MSMMQRVVLASRPSGPPVPENFRLETVDMPSPGNGQFLVRTVWMSLDPYMRGRMDDVKSYAPPVPLGGTMEAGCVAEVVESRHPDYQAGDIVVGPIGWASHSVSDGSGMRKIDPSIASISTALGVLGMPGHTAWVGLNDIAQAKAGETIVVSAATGAVGSLVGQLAKQKGMRVIGVAGGTDKCAHAVEDLQYDACLDHRAAADGEELARQIADTAPEGVDIYYENVGGKTLEAVIPNMNTFGRIVVCGMIAWYSGKGLTNSLPAARLWRTILTNRLRVQGFIIFDHHDRLSAFLSDVAPMVSDGRIRYRESVAEGLEAAPHAFIKMLEGGNFGKQVVRVRAHPA